MMWMNLEPITQNEVSQKEKEKYHILAYIYMESRKMALMNLFTGKQRENRHREQTYQVAGRKERVKYMERDRWKLTLPHVK